MTSINEKMGLGRAGKRSMMKLPEDRALRDKLTSAENIGRGAATASREAGGAASGPHAMPDTEGPPRQDEASLSLLKRAEAAEADVLALRQELGELRDAVAPHRHTPEDAELWTEPEAYVREVRELREAAQCQNEAENRCAIAENRAEAAEAEVRTLRQELANMKQVSDDPVIAGTGLEGRSGKPTLPDSVGRLPATSEHIGSSDRGCLASDVSKTIGTLSASTPSPLTSSLTVVHSSEIADDPAAFEGEYVPAADVDRLEAQLTALVAREQALREALEESVKMQSHYSSLLNQWDGGQRMQFASAEEWMARLASLALSRPQEAKP